MRRHVLASVLALGTLCAPTAAADQVTRPQRILILHYYGRDAPFRSAFDLDLERSLRAGHPGFLEVYSESLENYRFPGQDQARLTREYVREKYRSLTFNVIVAVWDPALQFARANRDELFPGVPIVALVARPFDNADAGVTGVWTGYTLAAAVEMVQHVQPATRRILVVDAALDSGAGFHADIADQTRLKQQVQITYLRDRPLADVLAAVSSAPADSVVLFIRQLMRTETEPVDQLEALARIAAASPVPIYVVNDALVGYGPVGGRVWSSAGNAALVAKMALQVAAGAEPRAIAPIHGVLNTVFDARELRRWGISESGLPPGSTVLFQEPTFWRAYRRYAAAAATVFAVQALLIVGLLVQRSRRRRAELALRRSEAKITATLEAIPDPMFLIRNDGIYLDYHAKDPRSLFAPPEQFLGKSIADIMPPDLATIFMREVEKASRSETTRTIEYSLPMPDGKRFFETRLVACDADSVLSIVREITEQKRAQEAICLSQDRYALATAAGGVGVWDWNLQSRQLYVDPMLKRMLGYQDGEITDRSEAWLDRVHPADRETTRGLVRACLEGRVEGFEIERRLLRKDGGVVWFESRASVLRDSAGRAERIVGTDTDVTDRKRVEEALRESEAVLRAEHAEIENLAGRLIAAQELERRRLAHELHDDTSQKLALLLIETERLTIEEPALPVAVAERLEQVWSRAVDIARDVHRLSHELHPSKLELIGLVSAIHALCRDVTAQHRIAVEFRQQQVPRQVDPDIALCLYRIVQEALHNAMKHSGASQALVELVGGEDVLSLCIADQGRGFDAAVEQPGLGLLSMRERVHFLGGQIAINSATGQGTRIGVRVPLRMAATSAVPGAAEMA